MFVFFMEKHLLSGVTLFTGPKTVLSPDFLTWVNVVPQDVAHPLYVNSPENVALRTQFLLDYLVQDAVSAQDPRLTQPQGLTVTNLGGRDLTFLAHDDGNLFSGIFIMRCIVEHEIFDFIKKKLEEINGMTFFFFHFYYSLFFTPIFVSSSSFERILIRCQPL